METERIQIILAMAYLLRYCINDGIVKGHLWFHLQSSLFSDLYYRLQMRIRNRKFGLELANSNIGREKVLNFLVTREKIFYLFKHMSRRVLRVSYVASY